MLSYILNSMSPRLLQILNDEQPKVPMFKIVRGLLKIYGDLCNIIDML